mmetsp:Transcript_12325/g.50696  ORF Transcript_12325/g.50696 Transcript_12325/m.50696 type:complete len:81 (-) Transcript_12325:251-493(-)
MSNVHVSPSSSGRALQLSADPVPTNISLSEAEESTSDVSGYTQNESAEATTPDAYILPMEEDSPAALASRAPIGYHRQIF